jgi:hypothetical protein
VDAPLVLAFLDHLEHDRRNTIRSRNAGLAAIRSFVHFAAFKEPGRCDLGGVLAQDEMKNQDGQIAHRTIVNNRAKSPKC